MNRMDEVRGALQRYVENRHSPGGCLEAALANNLMGFVGSADPDTLASTREICIEINKLPMKCCGSREKVQAWLNPPLVEEEEDGIPRL
jgi:hypothetical protein